MLLTGSAVQVLTGHCRFKGGSQRCFSFKNYKHVSMSVLRTDACNSDLYISLDVTCSYLLCVAYVHRYIHSVPPKRFLFYFLSCLEIFKAFKPEQSLEQRVEKTLDFPSDVL